MGFCRVQPYGSIGLLVSFFISRISYKYNLPSSECLTINDAWNILYLSISPTSSYTGNANRELYRYQPNFAFLQCFSSLFSRKFFPTAISISSGILVLHWLLPSQSCPSYYVYILNHYIHSVNPIQYTLCPLWMLWCKIDNHINNVYNTFITVVRFDSVKWPMKKLSKRKRLRWTLKTVDLLGCGSPPPLLTVRKRTAVG